MTLKAIEIFLDIEEEDIEFLKELEKGTKSYELIPEDKLTKISRLPEQDINYRLGRLNKFQLVGSNTTKYKGYRILPSGYDVLAIWKLVQKDVIEAFGKELGIGKEADIYDALTPKNRRVAIKFNRLGLSFTDVKEKRSYSPKPDWISASKKAARREFEVLKKLYPNVEVPEPVDYSRHALVMSLIQGEELAEVADIDLPEPVFDEIIRNVREAYKLGIIHGDLSEYNILVKETGEILIIDWPQWENKDHPEAERLLRRDIKNVNKFFERKFGLEKDLERTLDEIKS